MAFLDAGGWGHAAEELLQRAAQRHEQLALPLVAAEQLQADRLPVALLAVLLPDATGVQIDQTDLYIDREIEAGVGGKAVGGRRHGRGARLEMLQLDEDEDIEFQLFHQRRPRLCGDDAGRVEGEAVDLPDDFVLGNDGDIGQVAQTATHTVGQSGHHLFDVELFVRLYIGHAHDADAIHILEERTQCRIGRRGGRKLDALEGTAGSAADCQEADEAQQWECLLPIFQKDCPKLKWNL